MGFPGINIKVENGNLLSALSVLDSVPCLVATASIPANIGVVKQVYSLSGAEKAGYTAADEPFIHNILNEYYTELGGNQLLYILGTAETETMTDVLQINNTDGVLKALAASKGAINLVAIARKPSAGYDAGTKFLDADVPTAIAASKVLCVAQQAKNLPLRVFIEGRVANEDVANDYTPTEAENGYAAVVLGGTAPDGSGAVSLALARAVKHESHVKLGSGRNGALSALQIYVGTKEISEREDMETLHDAGFLTFHSRPGIAGYFFGRDNMCSTDDFRILAHGRVIDKAQRLAAIAYVPFIEDFARLNADGTINADDAAYLEKVAENAIRAKMGDQISDVKVVIDSNQDLVNTSNLGVSISVLPLGYLTWITITLGLTTSTSE